MRHRKSPTKTPPKTAPSANTVPNSSKTGDTILTHCNAGELATVEYGTALGVIRAAWEEGKKIKVIADETRPLLQGARLTTYELKRDGIPVTLITDNMAAYIMSKGLVQKVVVGADRIVQDAVFNKIGTYGRRNISAWAQDSLLCSRTKIHLRPNPQSGRSGDWGTQTRRSHTRGLPANRTRRRRSLQSRLWRNTTQICSRYYNRKRRLHKEGLCEVQPQIPTLTPFYRHNIKED